MLRHRDLRNNYYNDEKRKKNIVNGTKTQTLTVDWSCTTTTIISKIPLLTPPLSCSNIKYMHK